MKLICILRLKLNGAVEVVVKPSFSISDLSFLITAAPNDQRATITQVTARANGVRRADSKTGRHLVFTLSQADLNLYRSSSRAAL